MKKPAGKIEVRARGERKAKGIRVVIHDLLAAAYRTVVVTRVARNFYKCIAVRESLYR